MPLWYNPSTNGEKYASLACSDWETIYSQFVLEEVAFKDADTHYYLYAYASSITDVKYIKGEKTWTFEPQAVSFKIAKKDWEKWSYDEKKNVPVKQSIVEKFYCIAIERLDFEKVYFGTIHFQNIPQIKMALGDHPEYLDLTLKSMFTLNVLQGEPKRVIISELPEPKTGKGGGFSKSSGQTRRQQLDDNLGFIVDNLQKLLPQAEIKDLADIHYILLKEDDKSLELTQALHTLKIPFGTW